MLLRREQGMREALGQRRPVVQAGQCIVVRLPGHLVAKVPAFGHIVEHQHATHRHAVAFADGGGGVFNGVTLARAVDQDRVRARWAVCKGGGFCLLRICIQRRVQCIGQPKDLFQGPPHGLVDLAAGEELGRLVDGFDGAVQVGGDDAIAPWQMGRCRVGLLCLAQSLPGALPVAGGDQGAYGSEHRGRG